MRTMTVTCDACGRKVDDFNGGVTLAAGWGETARADACSHECVLAILRGFLKGLEERGAKVAADNAAFKKDHPEATIVGESVPTPPTQEPKTTPVLPASAASEPAVAAGCAACDQGVEVNVDTVYRHTGEGKLCKTPTPPARMVDGPCTCPTTGWTIEPKDDKPGPHVVTCSQCHVSWSVTIRSVEETENKGKKGKGRPAGAKNKKTLAAEAAAAAAAAAIPAETPENKAARDAALGRTPETSTDELERLKASREGAASVVMPVAAPTAAREKPAAARENLSQLVTDLAKLGLPLNLIEVAEWTSMQCDLARAWTMHPECEPPEFLVERMKAYYAAATQAPQAAPPPAAPQAAPQPAVPQAAPPPPAAAPPKSRFSFT
jgi:hypothetical protein